ncbi:cAMP-binding domain of CRP or a regulatory subunit of cAMP-dependent protein kinases [Paenibacillus uliginis N3/975]|uniref:cAMP-binding domain of CRP or a regulatory subunit of cAMP-dependent protein kinases n=1 Tax=Paenibacillus uliginis N3/975 TaxID=1313296 RepID=A0A1X7HG92_9BACL|nr:helix-turn-helix domain-containing protein [Paenibacillus uliginis]SMF86161.1 cAMP-binding domain of CRP or a regulatory subunit of cAMP-dependent protein kinases [Paenibacillus uliginis N3/975]
MKIIHDSILLQSKIKQFEIDQIFRLSDEIPFELRYYEPGELVLKEGEQMDTLLLLVEGRVKITSSVQTGKVLLLRFCEPFAVIGDIELIQKIAVQSQVEAVHRTLCIAVSFKYIYEHAIHEPKFLMSLLTHVTYKLQTCTTASRVNLLASVENRFASYLLTTIHEEYEFGKEIRTTNTQEIADLIGTTPRHLNRVILKLSEQGVIGRERDTIYILDKKVLQELSNGIRYE